MTTKIKIGDFVTLKEDSDHGVGYLSGHVREITENGVLLGYGAKTCPEQHRLWCGFDEPVAWRDIATVERQYPVVKRSPFTHQGKEAPVTSHEFEWRAVDLEQ